MTTHFRVSWMRIGYFLFLLTALLPMVSSSAAETEVQVLVKQVVAAAGGEDKLLKLFRIRERLIIGSSAEGKGSERVSVLEPPSHWWLGKKDRVVNDKEPATFLVWAWTLGAVVAPQSKLESIPDIEEADRAVVGLRISGSIDPPLDIYFEKKDKRLVRIDWRSDIHRFSEWKEHDGTQYPSKCVGYKKSTGKPWYFTEILELERLKELPDGLSR